MISLTSLAAERKYYLILCEAITWPAFSNFRDITKTSTLNKKYYYHYNCLLFGVDAKMMAVDTHRFEQLIEMLDEERIVNRGCQFDMTDMARAEIAVEATSHTSKHYLTSYSSYKERGSKGDTPRALS